MASLAKKEKPKIIIAGITSFPLALDFKKFSQVAESVDALLMADMSHVAGLILAGAYPNPVPYVHIITATTHKTIRGPRGAIIMVTKKGLKRDPEMGNKIDKAVFPGLQGGPHENNIAGIAVAFKEASKPAFKKYGRQIVKNAQHLAEKLKAKGLKLCSGGTNTHLILIDIMGSLDISGKLGAEALEAAGIVINYNGIPYDPNPPFFPSGLRLGTPAITSQGMKEKQMEQIAGWIAQVLNDISQIKKELKVSFEQEKKKEIREKIINKSREIKKVKILVKKLSQRFPIKKSY
jgi:glycine hydroxymethyltransferase